MSSSPSLELPPKPIIKSQSPTIAQPPFPHDGKYYFSNYQLAFLCTIAPFIAVRFIPFLSIGFWSYIFLFLLCGWPVTVVYWYIASRLSPHKANRVLLPGKPIDEYLTFNDKELEKEYGPARGKKIPMQVFHDAYFEGKIDIKGDMLEVLENRHDWASFVMTFELFKYVFMNLIPEVIFHSSNQDEEQVRDVYDRGDDFYEWFLGPRMIYTSGMIRNPDEAESLEQLQDNKLEAVCHKLDLQPTDKLLDIGCGWGTLAAFASKNYGCDVTGITLGKNQTKFGNDRIALNGVPSEQARILCMDARDIPVEPKGRYNKIVSLEMAEHVGIRRYNAFLRQVYDLLDDDGTFVFQVAGIRPQWQYEDLVWGLFMNKYVFPGADASLSLGWVISALESAGFEVRSVDVIGVHYSATLWRWYQNWHKNKEAVVAKYGNKWFRIWDYFLAASTITARQGGASCFQITLHKNLNSYNRVDGVKNHPSLHFKNPKDIETVKCQSCFEKTE